MPKRCPHCTRKIPFRKRFRPRCPFCFRPFRRRSGLEDRSLAGQWLEDRGPSFWFLSMIVVFGISSVALQLSGNPDLLNFIDSRPIWFLLTIYFASIFASMLSRIYFPLLLGAPRVLRRERAVIRQYRSLTTTGLILGGPFAIAFVGWHGAWLRFPATVYLWMIPVIVLWAYQALTLRDEDYDDERVWSFLQELGAQDRLEHRHHAYFTLIFLPVSGFLYYYFMNHPFLARAIMESERSGLIAMFRELWLRTTGRGV